MRDDQKSLITMLNTCIRNLDIPDKQKEVIQIVLDKLFYDPEIDLESIVDKMMDSGLNPIAPVPGLSKLYEEEE